MNANASGSPADRLKHWFDLAMQQMHPEKRVAEALHQSWPRGRADLDAYRKIWIFGAGKGAFGLARGVQSWLGSRCYGGAVIGPPARIPDHHRDADISSVVEFLFGDHPLPDLNSVESTRILLEKAREVGPSDLVFFAITGGASAMLCLPEDGVSLQFKQDLHRQLLASGDSIAQMNAVRKQYSAVKGGKLLRHFNGATVINLIVSDVPGDDPAIIGSGPTISDDPNVRNLWVATPAENARFLCQIAQQDGFVAQWNPESYSGPIGEVSRRMVADLEAAAAAVCAHPLHTAQVRIWHGESQVRVEGDGNGGRNQHLALLLCEDLARISTHHQCAITLLSAGTDGIDGNTSAAGAICDHQTAFFASEIGLSPQDFLRRFDSGTFFSRLDRIFSPGPTGNNLMDLQIAIISKNASGSDK